MDKIAICISTRNRPEAFAKCVDSLHKFWPSSYDAELFVVDDASDVSYAGELMIHGQYNLHTFTQRQGIPIVKNKCLEMAYNWNFDHLFLLDDDVIALSPESFTRYIESGSHHLSYTFFPIQSVIGNFKTHITPNGCMLYMTRACIDKVGGFDTNYSPGMFEHVDFSRRVYNNRMTHAPYMDLIGSEKLWYCSDQDKAIERSMSTSMRKKQFRDKIKYFNSRGRAKDYIKFM